MITVELRQATAADSQFAYQVRKAAFCEYIEMSEGWDEDQQRQLHERRFVAQEFRVISLDGLDIGIVGIAQKADCVKVNQLFILPDYQGRGIGESCMRRVIEDAASAGLPVRLNVLKVNPRAIRFYHRLGFQTIDDSESHVVMARLI